MGIDAPAGLTEEEFEAGAWEPLQTLREYVHETAITGAWLLKWFD